MKSLTTALFITCLIVCSCNAKPAVGTMASIQAEIETAFPDLAHIKADLLEKRLLSKPQNYLILDTRPAAEYNVSHIKGAVRVSPDISPSEFQSRFRTQVKNKSVIFYCSVGWRSSKAAHHLKNTAMAAGAIEIKNLEGGLFDWHNSGRPIVNTSGPTHAIHPYNEKWGSLILKKSNKSYGPR